MVLVLRWQWRAHSRNLQVGGPQQAAQLRVGRPLCYGACCGLLPHDNDVAPVALTQLCRDIRMACHQGEACSVGWMSSRVIGIRCISSFPIALLSQAVPSLLHFVQTHRVAWILG